MTEPDTQDKGTVEEFELRIVAKMGENPEWRYGQTCFNLLYEERAHISEQVRGTDIDPFYDDRKVPAFKAFVRQHWDDPVPEGFTKPTTEELLQNAFKKAWG